MLDDDTAGAVALDDVLGRVAERIVESGTPVEERVLLAMAAAIRHVYPGTAAALVDRDGAEVARLRAFGVAHGVVVTVLGPRDRARLLGRILGAPDLARAA